MQRGLCNGTVSDRLSRLSTTAAGLLLCARRVGDITGRRNSKLTGAAVSSRGEQCHVLS